MPNDVVVPVRDEEIPARIDSQSLYVGELRVSRVAPITGISIAAVAGVSGNDSSRTDFANDGIVLVADIEVAGGVEGQAEGQADFGGGRRSAVA